MLRFDDESTEEFGRSGRSSGRGRSSGSSRSRSDIVERVVNPLTGRWITVGSATYWDAVAEGYTLSDMRRAGSRQRPRPQRRRSPSSGVRSIRGMTDMRVARGSTSGRGQGGRTRGWAEDAPRRGNPRHAVMDKCGRQCFLDPDNEGFPVCSRLGLGQDCQLDCRGLYAAKVRAGQWKYDNVYDKADQLIRRKCRQ